MSNSLRCPTINELPPPPPGKTGWPWSEESPQLPATMPDGSPWPKVSIVTPSYNQGQFLEETIRSVLLQGYPNLEYIIMDGGSTDNSVEIIRKYEPWLVHWVSERDGGQADAINKGWRKSEGDILAWLNADDIYYSSILTTVATVLNQNTGLVFANCDVLNDQSQVVDRFTARQFSFAEILRSHGFIPQQTAFFKRQALNGVVEVNPDLHYVMDFELWLRITSRHSFQYIDATWAAFRMSADNKTIAKSECFWPEIVSVLAAFVPSTQVSADLLQIARHEAQFMAGLEMARVGKIHEAVPYIVDSFSLGYPWGNLTDTVYCTLSQLENRRWRKASAYQPLYSLELVIKELQSTGVSNHRLWGSVWMSLALQSYLQGDLAYTRKAALTAMRVSPDARTNQKLWSIFLKALTGPSMLAKLRRIRSTQLR